MRAKVIKPKKKEIIESLQMRLECTLERASIAESEVEALEERLAIVSESRETKSVSDVESLIGKYKVVNKELRDSNYSLRQVNLQNMKVLQMIANKLMDEVEHEEILKEHFGYKQHNIH